MKKTQTKGVVMLLITAFVWGSAFVAQSVGADAFPALSFNGIRTLFGAVVLLPVILLRELREKKKNIAYTPDKQKAKLRRSILNGIPIGLVLCVASSIQQQSFSYTAAGKVAFITAFYMFFVPLFGMLLGNKTPLATWGCVGFGIVGLYFLCIGEAGITDINKGDLLALLCSVGFAWHILVIERFQTDCDPIILSCAQFFTAGTLSLIAGLICEEPTLEGFQTALIPLLYSGVMSCGVAYTFQIVGQKYTQSTVASLIMCMESVFGVLSSAVVLHERLTAREISGCVIMFCAIVISQFSDRLTEKAKKTAKNRCRK